jgi:hypothetical protein
MLAFIESFIKIGRKILTKLSHSQQTKEFFVWDVEEFFFKAADFLC